MTVDSWLKNSIGEYESHGSVVKHYKYSCRLKKPVGENEYNGSVVKHCTALLYDLIYRIPELS